MLCPLPLALEGHWQDRSVPEVLTGEGVSQASASVAEIHDFQVTVL